MHRAVRPTSYVLLLATFFVASPAVAFDAWLRPQDSIAVEALSRYGTASSQYDENGTAIDLVAPDADGSVNWLDLTLRAEYGLFDDLSVAISTELRREWVEGPSSTATVTGIGDLGIGAGYSVWRDVVDVSFVLDTRWPTGYSAAPGGFVPSLGDAAITADALVVVGRRYDAPFEFSAATGYRFRGWRTDTPVGSTNLRDQIPLIIETRFEPRDTVRVDFGLNGAISFGRPAPFNELDLRPDAKNFLEGSLSVSTPFWERYRAGIGYQRTLVGIGALRTSSLLITLSLEDTI